MNALRERLRTALSRVKVSPWPSYEEGKEPYNAFDDVLNDVLGGRVASVEFKRRRRFMALILHQVYARAVHEANERQRDVTMLAEIGSTEIEALVLLGIGAVDMYAAGDRE